MHCFIYLGECFVSFCAICFGNEMKDTVHTYVVSFRVSISNSWLKELLVCACVSIFHLQRKRFYKDLHTFFFNA